MIIDDSEFDEEDDLPVSEYGARQDQTLKMPSLRGPRKQALMWTTQDSPTINNDWIAPPPW